MIDLHAHLDDEKLFFDLDRVLKEARENGVSLIVCPSVNFESIEKVLDISKNYNFVLPAIGVHPHDVKNINLDELENKLEFYLENNKFVAFSEIGLDYFYDLDFKEKQIKALEIQLNLAQKYNLPVILHNRDSSEDMISITKIFPNLKAKIIHSFSENKESAKKFLDEGFYLSFSGMITFKNNDDLREALKFTPIDRIFLETDSPYLSPEPFRGKINVPANVKIVYEYVCKFKNINFEDLNKNIEINFNRVFNK